MDITGPLSYSIQIKNGKVFCQNVDHIKFRSVITVNYLSQPYTKDTTEFDLFPTPTAVCSESTLVIQREPVQECHYPLRPS